MNEATAVADLEVGVDAADPLSLPLSEKQLEDPASYLALEIEHINLAEIDPDPDQARDEGADDELATSIAENGVRQPVVLRAHPTAFGRWMLVDGERRYRGALKAGLVAIPARVHALSQSVGDRLLEQNLLNDGKRLKPMEEARSWTRIMQDKGWNLQQLANALGRAKSTVSDRLAMLDAPAPFQPLFQKGVLTPAAAPIVRKFASLPESALKKIVHEASNEWRDFVQTESAVPLPDVESTLRNCLWHAGVKAMYAQDGSAKSYTGDVFTLGKERFAVDGAAYEAARSEYWKQRDTSSGEHKASKAALDAQQRAAAERKKHQQKLALRRAQFDAISAKLPTSIAGDWSEALVSLVMREVHQDTLRVLAAQLGLTKEKSRTGGMGAYGDMVKRHARSLTAQGRVRLALQLLLAPDLAASPYDMCGAERFAAAAKLLKIDLAKVKAPASVKAPKATTNTKAKKGKR